VRSRHRSTPLGLVLAERLHNAIQHGLARSGGSSDGTLELTAERSGDKLRVIVADNGIGFPEDFDFDSAASLGLQIVRTLVVSELGGTLNISARPRGGTTVELELPLPAADQNTS